MTATEPNRGHPERKSPMPPPVLQQDPDATAEQVAAALLRQRTQPAEND